MSERKFLHDRQPADKSKPSHGLSIATPDRKPANDHRSSDPYNTSGSFDRKKNWARVGKR